jgi:hypothetical protein
MKMSVPFSMDEFGAVLQAHIISTGHLVGRISSDWSSAAVAVTPVFVQPGREPLEWVLTYLPGYSILVAIAERFGVGLLLNPLLNLFSLFAMGCLARIQWKQDDFRRWLAPILLASSSQFIITGATRYSMPAHLALSLVWILLYRRGGKSLWLLGPVGAFASLIHQPIPHPLLVAPFLVRLLRERRFRLLTYLGFWYGAAVAFFVFWSRLGGGGSLSALGAPSLGNVFVLATNVGLLFSWSTPIFAILVLISLRRWSLLSHFERDLAIGVFLCLAFYLFFTLVSQGHGWGWRYGHHVLGNLCLLAAAAWHELRVELGTQRARKLLYGSLVLTAAVQLPWRVYVVHRFAEPFARAHLWLASRPEDVVVVPADSVWYGRDLIRNTPELKPPVLVRGDVLSKLDLEKIPGFRSLTTKRVSVDELERLGLERIPTPLARVDAH